MTQERPSLNPYISSLESAGRIFPSMMGAVLSFYTEASIGLLKRTYGVDKGENNVH
jgi:hypothetical protein